MAPNRSAKQWIGVYCVHCNADHPPGTEFDRDHVIQSALGAPDEFHVRVCKASNSRFGGTLDAEFADCVAMRFMRFATDTVGDRGPMPAFDFGEAMRDARGRRVPFRVSRTRNGLTIGPAFPVREVTESSLSVRGTRASVVRVVRQTNERQVRDGKKPFDGLQVTELTIEPGQLREQVEVNGRLFALAYIKMALNLGYFEMGVPFGRSQVADALRRALENGDPAGVRVSVPDAELLNELAVPGLHTIRLVRGPKARVEVVLFGRFAGTVRLGRMPIASTMQLHLIDPSSRRRHVTWSLDPRWAWTLPPGHVA